jgi:Zn-dependent protease
MLEYTLFFLIVLILSIILHEVAHGYAAEYLGDPTARLEGRLTLNPVSHIDPMGSVIIPAFLVLTQSPMLFGWAKPVPYNPYNLRGGKWAEAFVAFAGPGVNILLALGFGLIIRFFGTSLPEVTLVLASIITYTNIVLALFNLLPIPPLDGSKILRAVLPYRGYLAYVKFEQWLMGLGFIGLLGVLFVILLVIGPFIGIAFNTIFWAITGVPFF